jgi:hypothetical protein
MDPVCFTRPTASGAHQPWGVSCTEIIDFFWREYRVVAERERVIRRTLAAFERARRLRRPPT